MKCKLNMFLLSWTKFKVALLIYSTCLIVQSGMCQDTAKHDDGVLKNQQHELAAWGVQANVNETPFPTYFEKEQPKGSPYLSKNWMKGVLELSDHRRIPGINQYMFFNYDKYNLRLFLINKQNEISSYPVDSIAGFILVDGDKTYSFEKIPAIGKNFLLEPVLKSEHGFSLYKRLITRVVLASYISFGYTTEGQKYDEYIDEYEYYFIYPDKVTFRKFYLNEKSIRNAFRDYPGNLNRLLNKKDRPVTEEKLALMIDEMDNSSPYHKK